MQSRRGQIALNKKQIDFVKKMTEIEDLDKAVEKFAELMIREGADPTKMDKYIDKIIERQKK